MTILQNNESIEANAELILKLEATGYLPKMDYAKGAVVVPRDVALAAFWAGCIEQVKAMDDQTP